MTSEEEQPTQAWLDRLEQVLAGHQRLAAGGDDLLHLAERLSTTLAPLRTLNQAEERHRRRLLGRLYDRRVLQARKRSARVRVMQLAALLLLVVLIRGMLGAGVLAGVRNTAGEVWNTATSLQQVQGVSLAELEQTHPGLHPLPLLPTALPGDAESAVYGVVTDAHDLELMKSFVADYRIGGQDVALFEQPSSFPLTSAAAQPVPLGALQGQLFQDAAGDHALQWYQDGMVCQLTSRLPVERLVALARVFRPITNWDIIR